ncbi:MAG: GDSL-type esterase/lipase family protein [Actinomycetota bacterium]|nr:GDSL-type esterase/lipase family protein [Actinomycetota bacterium]
MTPRPEQPEPFLRGVAYGAYGDVPYPRADPTDLARLPSDIWHAAVVPAGVRLELVGDADAVDIAYRTVTSALGYRREGAGTTFDLWRHGQRICREEAALGEATVRLPLGEGPAERPAVVYFPEGMHPTILSVTAVGGEISPAPRRPRWLAMGDSVTQGWLASSPSHAWTAIAARKALLDVVNFGYAGAGRFEIASAEQLADLPADVITVAAGANCWGRVPHNEAMVREQVRAFLELVRLGHRETPLVVISPLARPDAETAPNRLGATLGQIRAAIEGAVDERIDAGDAHLELVRGQDVITTELLVDGIHPGDEGHRRIAATVGKFLSRAATESAPRSDVRRADSVRPPRGIRTVPPVPTPPAPSPPAADTATSRSPAPVAGTPVSRPGAPGTALGQPGTADGAGPEDQSPEDQSPDQPAPVPELDVEPASPGANGVPTGPVPTSA